MMTITGDRQAESRVKYIGPDILTRGEYGERISYGYRISDNGMDDIFDPDGEHVVVWDSSYGWTMWGRYDSQDWAAEQSTCPDLRPGTRQTGGTNMLVHILTEELVVAEARRIIQNGERIGEQDGKSYYNYLDMQFAIDFQDVDDPTTGHRLAVENLTLDQRWETPITPAEDA